MSIQWKGGFIVPRTNTRLTEAERKLIEKAQKGSK